MHVDVEIKFYRHVDMEKNMPTTALVFSYFDPQDLRGDFRLQFEIYHGLKGCLEVNVILGSLIQSDTFWTYFDEFSTGFGHLTCQRFTGSIKWDNFGHRSNFGR